MHIKNEKDLFLSIRKWKGFRVQMKRNSILKWKGFIFEKCKEKKMKRKLFRPTPANQRSNDSLYYRPITILFNNRLLVQTTYVFTQYRPILKNQLFFFQFEVKKIWGCVLPHQTWVRILKFIFDFKNTNADAVFLIL